MTPINSPGIPLPQTINATDAIARDWDVIVIGAGPAGGMTALRLAKAGLDTLLVEAKPFPRDKVCGGCLNQRSWSLLAECGLDQTLRDAGASPLSRMRLVSPNRQADWPLPTMMGVSRALLDQVIVNQAVASGVRFLPMTTAQVDPSPPGQERRCVKVAQRGALLGAATAKVVVCADGLGHPSLKRLPEFDPRVNHKARLGLGAILEWDKDDEEGLAPGTLTMAAGRLGYVGLARIERGRLNVAAALDRRLLQASPDQGAGIAAILRECRLHAPTQIASVSWMGTLPLTRISRKIAGERLFLVGDAAGYVEPFTGEGMSWAMKSAMLAAPIITDAVSAWDLRLTDRWQSEWKRKVFGQQWKCRLLSKLMRSPRMADCALSLCQMVPALPNRVIRSICDVPTVP